MKAIAVTEARGIAVIDVDEPEPRADEVVVRVARAGICGSDLHALKNSRYRAGAILGHEISGDIVAHGDAVTGWEPGQRVALYHGTPCGLCSTCRAGHPHICRNHFDTALGLGTIRGGMAERLVVHHSLLHPLADTLSYEAGALAEPLSIAIHGVAKANVNDSSKVAVLGAGPIGAMAACALRARGTERVVVIDPNPLRREAAARMGFDVLGPEDAGAGVRDILGGPADAVLECSGHPSAAGQAVSLAKATGRVVLQGVPLELVPVSQFAIVQKEVEIVGAASCAPAELDEALEHLAAGRIPLGQLVTEVAPLGEAARCFGSLINGDGRHLKIQLDPTR
ncbi:zinc-binding dehydrogenase [Streptomyces sp. NPDC058221]|uniref:zinc-dependent alcohol dehydrogenase n=1 Tax=Streptomyces sp. NPDC058221 TaxID=3346388 RepID=UPI0036E2310E